MSYQNVLAVAGLEVLGVDAALAVNGGSKVHHHAGAINPLPATMDPLPFAKAKDIPAKFSKIFK
jgi:hypothetical protein